MSRGRASPQGDRTDRRRAITLALGCAQKLPERGSSAPDIIATVAVGAAELRPCIGRLLAIERSAHHPDKTCERDAMQRKRSNLSHEPVLSFSMDFS